MCEMVFFGVQREVTRTRDLDVFCHYFTLLPVGGVSVLEKKCVFKYEGVL